MRYDKVSPSLISTCEEYMQEGRAELAPRARLMGLHPAIGRPTPARVTVFLRVDANADLSSWATQGVEINQSSGEIRTAILPLDRVDPLSDDPSVHRIIPSRVLRPLMDVASTRVKLPAFRASSHRTGKGVIIGIVDSGIDGAHPSFAGRILQIWDQTAAGPPAPGIKFGALLVGPAVSSSVDTSGHGTHVAGIAAGAHATFGGVAPAAELIVVKTDFDTTHIADGVRYIFAEAKRLNRPAVVNLSLGGHFDAHDGSDPLSDVINKESGPGRIVCCAAGNEGTDNIHAAVDVAPGTQVAPRFVLPMNRLSVVELNAWYPGGPTLEVAVQSPGGFITPFQGISSGPGVPPHLLPDARVRIVAGPPNPANGAHQIHVSLRGAPGNPAVAGGVWRLFLRNPSSASIHVDAWTLDGQSSPEVTWSGSSISDSMKIGSPGTAAEAITVAAFTSRVSWTDGSGALRTVGLKPNDIADFSSEGPLRNGARKPDLAAPGAMIVSCRSSSATVELGMDVSPQFMVEAGTSMATPFVTGIVAMLLEENPALTPTQAKSKLAPACAIPGQAAGVWDPKWGFGLLDASRL